MNRLLKGALLVQVAAATVAIAENQPAPAAGQEARITDSADKRMPEGCMRASQLIGVNVYDRDGKHFGEVKNLVLNSTDTRIGFAIVEFEGIDTAQDRAVALPLLSLRFSPSDDRIYVKADKDAIVRAPALHAQAWSVELNPEYYARLQDFCQQYITNMSSQARNELAQASGKPSDVTMPEEAQAAAGRLTTPAEPTTWNKKCTDFIGRSVQSPAGEDLGKINDLVIDTSNGNVRYAVLTYGGTMGVGDKLFAMPVSAFKYQVGSEKVVLDTTPSQLKGSPGFDKSRWPAEPQATWTNPHSY